jgi:hypothetical protein
MLALTTDGDFLVAHVAMQALVALNAQDVCLNAVEPSTTPGLTAGALRVLKQIHDVKIVNALIERVPKLSDPTTRALGYAAICRLVHREADWTDAGWWGTRPDRTGHRSRQDRAAHGSHHREAGRGSEFGRRTATASDRISRNARDDCQTGRLRPGHAGRAGRHAGQEQQAG